MKNVGRVAARVTLIPNEYIFIAKKSRSCLKCTTNPILIYLNIMQKRQQVNTYIKMIKCILFTDCNVITKNRRNNRNRFQDAVSVEIGAVFNRLHEVALRYLIENCKVIKIKEI